MINKELVEVFSEIAREKNVERSELGSIIESLFLHLIERERGESSNCSVIVNLDKGEFEIYVEKIIVDDVEDPVLEISLEELIQSERYRRGDTVRAVIKSVEITSKGPDIVVSRSDNHFLYKMFEMEVPEIEDGVIEIRSIARYPGERAKIIVQSHDRRIDPVGACVGMRGSRIQSIVRELNNEKIDIGPSMNHVTLIFRHPP